MRKIRGGRFFRNAEPVKRDAIDIENRTVELAYSSEGEFERVFGIEVLSHEDGAQDLSRLNNGGALLMDHDPTDQVGVIEKAWVDPDRVGRARVRFGSSARATEVFTDVVEGIRSLVSVGYWVHEMDKTEERDSGPDVYTVTRYEPLEISLVSIPADPQVGVGRHVDEADQYQMITISNEDDVKEPEMAEEKTTAVETPQVDVNKERESAVQSERKRCQDIRAIGKRAGATDLAEQFCNSGKGLVAFCEALNEREVPDSLRQEIDPNKGDIGLTDREASDFSFMRAIRAQAFPNERKFQQEAGFERECSRAAEKATGKTAQGILVPSDVLKRDLVVGTESAGGYLVDTDLVSWIELLRNKMMVMQMGASSMGNLVGDVSIPKQTAASTAYWVAESDPITESQQTLGQLQLTPKTVGAFTDLSRRFILQSSRDAEGFVRNDIAAVIARAIDLAALHGTGTGNQPAGLAVTSGIGSVVGGDNGLAPTWAHIVELETDVAVANAAVGSLGYLTNAKVRGKLKQTMTIADYGEIPIWTQQGNPDGFGVVNGYRAGVSNQVSSTLDKGTSTGVCSMIAFGDWSQLGVYFWSGLDILTDPYTGSTSGTVRIVGMQDCDVGVRQAGAFSLMLDALTA
jgi:HK97 family phage major capsid protein